jgi:hypothetical protein
VLGLGHQERLISTKKHTFFGALVEPSGSWENLRVLTPTSRSRVLAPALSALLSMACGSDPLRQPDASDPGWTPSPERAATASAIGTGDGSSGSVRFEAVFEPSDNRDRLLEPTGLAWHGQKTDELWVTLRFGPDARTCNTDGGACPWLEGHVAIVAGATTLEPGVTMKVDANAWHFMRRPTGIAWGAGDRFATCGEARTGNYEDDEFPYNGPTLWTADPAIFAEPPPPGANGTHLDMLHSSPFCMGIAHEVDSIYWVFNGDAGALDRYDFHEPHQPGGEDHSDGEVWRYALGELQRVPEVPAHLAYEPASRLLYVSDPGHSRVIALDTATGAESGEIISYDGLRTHALVTGATVTEIVRPGEVARPSGLALVDGVLFVADRASGRITAWDVEAKRPIRSLDTGFGPDALTALSYGPDGKLYASDIVGGRVLRIEPN